MTTTQLEPGKTLTIVPTGLTFDEPTHAYAFNGRPLISVTQAIKAAGLIDLDWCTEFARDRGRAVHKAIHFDAEGDLDENTVSPTIRPYLEAARKFKQDTGFTSGSAECRVCVANLGYAGTLDWLYAADKKLRVLVDWKSGLVRSWCRLQTAAYANAFPNGSTFLRYGVQLKPDATYKITAFEPKAFREDVNDFHSCLRVAQMQLEEFGCLQQ
jgi:hypothetical protein